MNRELLLKMHSNACKCFKRLNSNNETMNGNKKLILLL